MKVKFEEKTYESYFNNELDQKSSIYFPPGQVLEGALGFDASSFTRNRRLWRMLGYPCWFFPPFHGVDLQDVAHELNSVLGHIVDGVPKVKANLFIQYKRPEYITARSGKEWSYWNEAYFRYKVDRDQQKILFKIDQKFGSQALVVYASPAISTLDELVICKKKSKIIESTNFKKARDLNNHNRNTYIQSGVHSIACSEPQKIENLNLLSELERLDSISGSEMKQVIINTSNIITEEILENSKLGVVFKELMAEYRELENYKMLYAHLILKCFREISGIQWLVACA